MASKVDIMNRALQLCGEQRILSPDDTSRRADIVNFAYTPSLEFLQRAYVWNFNKKRVTLAPLSNAPSWGFEFQYALPHDFLRFIDKNSSYDHSIEADRILTDAGPTLDILYAYLEEDTNKFDSLFTEMLAHHIAMNICEELTQSNTKKQDLELKYDKVSYHAVSVDSKEGSPDILPSTSWADSRF